MTVPQVPNLYYLLKRQGKRHARRSTYICSLTAEFDNNLKKNLLELTNSLSYETFKIL